MGRTVFIDRASLASGHGQTGSPGSRRDDDAGLVHRQAPILAVARGGGAKWSAVGRFFSRLQPAVDARCESATLRGVTSRTQTGCIFPILAGVNGALLALDRLTAFAQESPTTQAQVEIRGVWMRLLGH